MIAFKMISHSFRQRVKGVPIFGSLARWFRDRLIERNPGLFLPVDLESAKETRRHLGFGVDYVYYAQVEGDLAEFGTMAGISAVALAQQMILMERILGRSARKLLLFDSFKGLPESTAEPDLHSPHVQAGIWAAGTCKVLSKDQLLSAITSRTRLSEDRIQMYEGWYKSTVPTLPRSTRLSLIHVDCDLYQSTLDALDPLFAAGQLSEGAVILFDDWNCNRASPLYGEQKAWSELVAKYSIGFSDGGGYSWAGHKVIVHEYRGIDPSFPP
jgi:O-methyltransferase